jgi:hypothetical protein
VIDNNTSNRNAASRTETRKAQGRKSPRKTDRDGGAGAKFWLAGR